MNLLLPVNWSIKVCGDGWPRRDSAARYTPAGHPSVRASRALKSGPSSVWFVVLFCGLMLIGLVWLLVFQLASNAIPFLAELGPWNYAIAFAFMITGLLLTMRWR